MIGINVETGPLAITTSTSALISTSCSRVGLTDQEGHGEHNPRPRINEHLQRLFQLEVGISNACIVRAEACDGDVALSISEAFHSDGIGWHEEEDDE